MTSEADKIELKSDKVNEILEQVPSWTIRWGSAVALLAIILLFLVAFFIKYPDILVSRVTITSNTLPKEIKISPKAKSNELTQLFVLDNQLVKKDGVLAVIDNSAVYEDVNVAKKQFQQFRNLFTHGNSNQLGSFSFSDTLQLGDIQLAYFDLITAVENYKLYIKYQFHRLNIQQLSQQLSSYKKLKQSLQNEKKITEEQVVLSKQNFERDSIINALNYTAKAVFEEQKKKYLDEKIRLEKLETQLINIDLFVGQKRESMLLVSTDSIKTKNNLLTAINIAQAEFQHQLQTWEDTYVLQSPIDGYVSYTQPLQQGQHIQVDKELMIILPNEKNLFAYTYIPSDRSGKVALDQDVKIRLDGFPFKEYGVVEGKISSISKVTLNGNYYVQIKISNGLETNFHKKLPFTANMQGEARIITEKLRFLERVFYQLRYSITNE